MKKEKLPINCKILQWSRESIGLSIEDVASKLKKDSSIIESWETGEDSPTYPQLEKLSYDLYKRPVAVFFLPEIPVEDSPITDFRTLPEALTKELPSEIIKLYRKAKFFQMSLEELFEGEFPTRISLLKSFSLKDESNYNDLSMNVRNFAKIDVDTQFSWGAEDIALKNWRNKFEEYGVFVFKDAFKNNDYSGFCIYDEKYPVIFLNNSMPFSRQIFTLAHELGHLLFHSGGIDFRENGIIDSYDDKYIDYERACNQFASELLVPSNYFNDENLSVSEDNINCLAKKYSVSREVILRKFYDSNQVNSKYYNQLIAKWKKAAKHKKSKSGGNYYYTHKSYLGENYINLVFSRYYQNKINLESLSQYLNIKAKNVVNFEHHVFN